MTAKKKDLATELINDLLGEASGSTPEVPKPTGKNGSEDRTVRLELPKQPETQRSLNPDVSVKTSVGRYAVRPGTGVHGANEAHLFQVENLRVAQQKILDLEDELGRLRQENEKVVAAAEALRRENDDLSTKFEQASHRLTTTKEAFVQEKEILEQSGKAKERELKELRIKVSEFETRLASNLQRIRVRERELENRLELIKMENSALSRNKDEMLLDLKRQIDQMNNELDNYRRKTQELNKKFQDKQELVRRTVKALRLALSLLEGDESSG